MASVRAPARGPGAAKLAPCAPAPPRLRLLAAALVPARVLAGCAGGRRRHGAPSTSSSVVVQPPRRRTARRRAGAGDTDAEAATRRPAVPRERRARHAEPPRTRWSPSPTSGSVGTTASTGSCSRSAAPAPPAGTCATSTRPRPRAAASPRRRGRRGPPGDPHRHRPTRRHRRGRVSGPNPLSVADTETVTEVVFDATFEGRRSPSSATTEAPFRVFLLEGPHAGRRSRSPTRPEPRSAQRGGELHRVLGDAGAGRAAAGRR